MRPSLYTQVPSRDAIFTAVYQYWVAKRKRLGKPMLRRLQAPTAITDTNPFNVFRYDGNTLCIIRYLPENVRHCHEPIWTRSKHIHTHSSTHPIIHSLIHSSSSLSSTGPGSASTAPRHVGGEKTTRSHGKSCCL